MFKIMRSLVLCVALAALFNLPAQAVVLKIATVAPEGSMWMQEMRQGAAEIKERTGGRVSLKFFGGGVMGNEKSVLRKIRIGQLHGGAFTGGGLAGVYPDINLYGLPLVFRSLDEVDYVRQRMDPVLIDGLEKAGFISFGFGEGGFANLMSPMPVRTVNDLKGQKIWIPEGDRVNYAMMEALGLSPVTLPLTDVLTGLQTGLIDIVGTSPIGAIAFQWHTKVKYVTRSPFSYLFATLVVDRRAFGRLSTEDQTVLREVMERIYAKFNVQTRLDNEGAEKALSSQGLTLLEPEAQEVASLVSTAEGVIRSLEGKGLFTPELYEQMRRHLANFRGQGKQASAQ